MIEMYIYIYIGMREVSLLKILILHETFLVNLLKKLLKNNFFFANFLRILNNE